MFVAGSGHQVKTLDIDKFWWVATIYVPPEDMQRTISIGLRQTDTEWVTNLNSEGAVHPQSSAGILTLPEQERAPVV